MINRIALTGLVLAPFVYLATLYPDLPARIPLHFDWRGQPDAWGPKYVLWAVPVIGVLVALLTDVAVRKAAEAGGSPAKHRSVGYLTVGFTTAMLCYILHVTQAGGFDGLGGISVLLGLLFGGLGNYLPVIARNPYVGIRVPPTLNSDEVWRKTHRFAGPIFFLGGVLLVVNGLLLRGGAETVGLLVLIGIMAIVPIVYAYRQPGDHDDQYV